MQLTTAIFTTLCLALSAKADSAICFPVPGQPSTVPQSTLDLDSQTKLNWAATLCSQLTFPSDGLQTAVTSLADGIKGDDGKLYGLEVAVHDIQTEDNCNVNANALLGTLGCPGGGLLTLSGPLEQWSYITALN
ncbi:uncharacterized protein TrAFT101_007684 [Trichoderma asperellum]|uniref:Ecp2 effector protein domain-containing protein n=1 Tax=Trichoderma asperellum (strain ATCC 204424 / CBS 433.97 / NBRC 101777) TaxID=1042311 RepID=A0A2T3Z3Y8_TRIA4|nr:hypothetical protein M441DRAFT_48692 [Trichoderma asperellum CBS 433.97]PTB39538.1 hypothetical protein M441DRAFT_48692 [Trichoderma asperellum CBS 433.97]UKZ92744.1 hypothetical protein TrAFT101_007684 [Trichoderma asperellum]